MFLFHYQVDSIELFAKDYEKVISVTRRKQMRGSLWDFYRYYKQKKGFQDTAAAANTDSEDIDEFALVENVLMLDNDIELEINKM